MRHVITLSTIPPRFDRIGPALQGLLAQRARPEAIELYIPRSYRRYPAWGGGLPAVPDGVSIVRVDEDLGPGTKVLPAARAWRGQGVELVYLDDDRIYGRDLTRRLAKLRRAHPAAAICGAALCLRTEYGYDVPPTPTPRMVPARCTFWTLDHQWRRLARVLRRSVTGRRPGRVIPKLIARSGYADIAEGQGAVLVRPEVFDDAAYVIPPVLWAVDDIWLSGVMARRGVPIWADRGLYHRVTVQDASGTDPLYRAVIEGADRHAANRACIDHLRATYGIWGGTAAQSA